VRPLCSSLRTHQCHTAQSTTLILHLPIVCAAAHAWQTVPNAVVQVQRPEFDLLVATDNPFRLTRVEGCCETVEVVLKSGRKPFYTTQALDLNFIIQYATISSQALGHLSQGPQTSPPLVWNGSIFALPTAKPSKHRNLSLPRSYGSRNLPPYSYRRLSPVSRPSVQFRHCARTEHKAMADTTAIIWAVEYWPVRAKLLTALVKLDANL